MAAAIGVAITIAFGLLLASTGLIFLVDFRGLGSRVQRWHHYVNVVPWKTPGALDEDDLESRRIRDGWWLMGFGILFALAAVAAH